MVGLEDMTRTLDGLRSAATGWAGSEEHLAENPGSPYATADRADAARTRDALRQTVRDAASAGAIRPRTAQRLAGAQTGAEAQALLLPLAWADEARRDLTDRLGPADAMRALAADLAMQLVAAARQSADAAGMDLDAGNALAGWAECAYAAGLLSDAQLDTLSGSDYLAARTCAERFAFAALRH